MKRVPETKEAKKMLKGFNKKPEKMRKQHERNQRKREGGK